MRANQIRLYFSSIAYVLAAGAAAAGAGGDRDGEGAMPDDPAEAAEDRRAGAGDGAEGVGAMASSCPYADIFRQAHEKLTGLPPLVLDS